MTPVTISCNWHGLLAAIWREHRGPIALLGASSALIAAIAMSGLAPTVAHPLLDWPTLLISLLLAGDLVGLAILGHRLRHRVSFRAAISALQPTLLGAERLAGLAISLFIARWVVLLAVAWKTAIPALHPFAYDRRLAALDAAVFGRAPWEWLRPVIASPIWLRVLDVFYYAWFPVLLVAMVAVGWAPYGARRRRFLLAMAAIWAFGSWIGVLVSSAGPVYFSFVTGTGSSFDQLAQLVSLHAPIAAGFQRALREAYFGGGGGLVAGISAFPSMHVAMPALLALAAPRRWRLPAVLFWLIIWADSIALGWHYWTDGAAGSLMSTGCWWGSGRIMAPPHERRMVDAFAPAGAHLIEDSWSPFCRGDTSLDQLGVTGLAGSNVPVKLPFQ